MPSPFQLSVIVPHLNEPDDLRRCLAALVSQRTHQISFEIVVVDNGSGVMPHDVCAGIDDLRLLREPIPGPGPARNLGARTANAELLAFIDADCVAQPGWVAAIVERMACHGRTAFGGGDIQIRPANALRLTAIECYESIYAYNARAYVEHYGFAATGNMAVWKQIFQTNGPFGGISIMEDTDWGRRATRAGYKAVFLPEAKVVTPSCATFAELARRWDRHIAHEFSETTAGGSGTMIKWLLRACAIAASPIAESIKILGTDRVRGARNRWLAFSCLTRVRLYRAWRMLCVALEGDASGLVNNWNRKDP
ncbi:glycosyltransferase [Rhizobium sp. Leaf262]|uniref:glycosyltransferase n=1 Tax=Rhizobium sp. Leaf262 TaxID=1736312 RepID=UPI0007146BE5|nr:glycosyltransferase [Rhizobium sp. Leaf262]KQO76274.1 glycosyltransferase [Rhizobium sp. Leaf262]